VKPDHDVIIVGGGPAGSTSASLLSRAGAKVLVLEKETFPRFHIGESLLPRSLPLLARLGMDMSGARYKGGAEFFDEVTGDYARYPFQDSLPGTDVPGHAYQVERGPFDTALLACARSSGAHVRTERVQSITVDDEAATVTTDKGRYSARYCIDATGQDAFLARRDRCAEPYDSFGRAAVFTHYDGIGERAEEIIGPEGNIKVLITEAGWGWLIPLAGGRLSVGAVTRNGGVTPELLERAIASSPLTQSLTEGSRRLGTHVIRNFSYKSSRPCGARYTAVGDAAAFLDPVFSSGVALAMLGAEAVSDRLTPALAEGREDDPDLMKPVWTHMERAYVSMSSLIHAFYHTGLVRNLFFSKKPDPLMRAGLITILSLDVWRDDNPFQDMLLRSRRRLAWGDSSRSGD
jgi:flavin-dependent dehydrogenase